MAYNGPPRTNWQDELNRCMPVAAKTKLGDVIYNLVNGYNDLVTKYNALLAHLDTADVAGIGNTNVATFGEMDVIKLPEQRTYRINE